MRLLTEGWGAIVTRHKCTELLEGHLTQWAFRKGFLHYFHRLNMWNVPSMSQDLKSAGSREEANYIYKILFLLAVTGKSRLYYRKKRTQITIWNLLLSLLFWVMDYLDIRYGFCARKTIYCLDTAYQITNVDSGKKKHLCRKLENNNAKGRMVSCHHTSVHLGHTHKLNTCQSDH